MAVTNISTYKSSVYDAWVSEFVGEAIFEELARIGKGTPLEKKWKVLANLERLMGRRLESVLAGYGCDLAPPRESIEQRLAAANALLTLDSQVVMAAMEPYIKDALRRYRVLRSSAPEEDAEALQLLVDHEAALLRFVQKERVGDLEDSTREAREVIGRLT